MGEIKVNLNLGNALDRIVGMLVSNESAAFIASEFLISHEIQQNLVPETKFARALSEAEVSIRKSGFEWWEPPSALRQIVDVVRVAVERSDQEVGKTIILSLLTEIDPVCIRKVRVD